MTKEYILERKDENSNYWRAMQSADSLAKVISNYESEGTVYSIEKAVSIGCKFRVRVVETTDIIKIQG
jgi:hypothetical protein